MNSADIGALAWALADSANAFMNPAQRTRVCAKIGAGEQDSAIADVLASYATTNAELPFELAGPIRRWINGYAGTDSEQILRHLYGQIKVPEKAAASNDSVRAERDCPPMRLVAKRSERATRSWSNTGSSHSASRVAVFGMTTCVAELVDAAVEARRLARTATEVAVREARSMDWSWERIAAALGGNPDPELLRRTFG